MNIWVLTLWIVFKTSDGGMTVVTKIPLEPGSNRATCEYLGQTTSKDMMLNGIPEINKEGKKIILYPSQVRDRCELE